MENILIFMTIIYLIAFVWVITYLQDKSLEIEKIKHFLYDTRLKDSIFKTYTQGIEKGKTYKKRYYVIEVNVNESLNIQYIKTGIAHVTYFDLKLKKEFTIDAEDFRKLIQ